MSKKKNRITFAGIINAIILGLFTLICVYPLWYIFINSWSSPAAVNRGVYIIPQEFSTEAYTNLLEIPGLTSSIGIAFARTILGTLLTLLCCSFAAYLLANRDLPCRKLLYRFFIVTMYVNAGFIPYYLLISNIGLKNNFLVYILPYAVQPPMNRRPNLHRHPVKPHRQQLKRALPEKLRMRLHRPRIQE